MTVSPAPPEEDADGAGVSFRDAWLLAASCRFNAEVNAALDREKRDAALLAGNAKDAALWATQARADARRAEIFTVLQVLADRCHDDQIKRRLAELAKQSRGEQSTEEDVIYDHE